MDVLARLKLTGVTPLLSKTRLGSMSLSTENYASAVFGLITVGETCLVYEC
jgi:hypothetical protein